MPNSNRPHGRRRRDASRLQLVNFVKLDFYNAFNSLHRHDMLLTVLNRVPELYAYCCSAYIHPPTLFFLVPIRLHPRKDLNKVIQLAPSYSAAQFSHCFLLWLVTLGGPVDTVALDLNRNNHFVT